MHQVRSLLLGGHRIVAVQVVAVRIVAVHIVAVHIVVVVHAGLER